MNNGMNAIRLFLYVYSMFSLPCSRLRNAAHPYGISAEYSQCKLNMLMTNVIMRTLILIQGDHIWIYSERKK